MPKLSLNPIRRLKSAKFPKQQNNLINFLNNQVNFEDMQVLGIIKWLDLRKQLNTCIVYKYAIPFQRITQENFEFYS